MVPGAPDPIWPHLLLPPSHAPPPAPESQRRDLSAPCGSHHTRWRSLPDLGFLEAPHLTSGGTSQGPLGPPIMAHLELAHELCEDAKEGLRGGGFGVLAEEGQRPAQLLHGLTLQPVQSPQYRLGRL